MECICGIYQNRETASKAMTELMAAGIHQLHISLVLADTAAKPAADLVVPITMSPEHVVVTPAVPAAKPAKAFAQVDSAILDVADEAFDVSIEEAKTTAVPAADRRAGSVVDPFAVLLDEAVVVPGLTALDTHMLVAGPLAVPLLGEAAADIGGLAGALMQFEVPAEYAHTLRTAVQQGQILLAVHPETESQGTVARAVLVDSGALTAAA